ncbi:fimbria/pilus outer membrane usher protein [Moellerella wisconsensis]|uniref:MrfC family outer membrane usher protein n=1 Tax=Moellerella wisconsensis ATCC 35017 TaxID=1354267 RepID=A0A0N0IB44_9GAMM|nr:fimbria/pilus outer membrane usher protein [Moellerella wisconsensis]KPD03592.1 MrfC family outer membrane usher protein [Moellerella wisconsensis ATCC 35017]
MKLNKITKIMLMLLIPTFVLAEESVDFNTDFLDDINSQNTDFSKFSRANYVLPGSYTLTLLVNKQQVSGEQLINFFIPTYDKDASIPCITKPMFSLLGLKPEWDTKVAWLENDTCLDPRSIPEMTLFTDLGKNTLNIGIAQAYIEYDDPNWDPPSRWDDGIPGFFVDYNTNGKITKFQGDNTSTGSQSGLTTIGTMGFNAGAWRLRADWQSQIGNANSGDKSWAWNQFYLYRAIRSLSAKLTFGEQFLSSTLFDSFRYIGASLETDESMFPPRLMGYAPEVAGVAKTNATVVVRQNGSIIFQTEVSPGPFRIQDINSFGGGTMHVSIKEQDGSIQKFTVETSSLGTLTRPGQFIYKLVVGKSSQGDHKTQGPAFSLGSFSWGATNNTTIYGGLIASGEYQNIAFGIGRDLAPLGVLSANISHSRAQMGSLFNDQVLSGNSYNINYSKRFDSINSQITFAGYRFSEKNYMNMNQFIDKRYNSYSTDNGKELYTIIFGTAFPDSKTNVYLNYSHQTYWNKPTSDQYNITLSQLFDLGPLKNLSANISAYKMKSKDSNNDGVFLSLNVPLENNKSSVSYSTSITGGSMDNTVNYYQRLDDRNSYSLSGGTYGGDKINTSGIYNYDGDSTALSLNGSYMQDNQTSLSMQVKGGMTVTGEGGAFHRMMTAGSSRILVDTDDVADVPFAIGVNPVRTNHFGKAVLSANAGNYSRSNIRIDLDNLPDNIEAINSMQYATLTEGAIGYRKFQVLEGQKVMAVITDKNNQHPPFGSTVVNKNNIEVGIIADNGFVYISGVKPQEQLNVLWGDNKCDISLPEIIDSNLSNTILLPCSN